MAREGLYLNHSLLSDYDSLSDSEFGRLIRAALAYSAGESVPALIGKEAMLWKQMQRVVDYQEKRYDEKCRQNAEKSRKARASACARWDKKKRAADGEQSAADSCERMRTHTNACIKYKYKNTPLTPRKGAEGGEGSMADEMYQAGIAQAAQCWQENIGVLSPAVGQQLAEWVQLAEPAMVCEVIRYAALAGKYDGRYIGSIVRNAAARNITTLAAWQAEQLQRQQKNAPAGENKEKEEAKRRWL